MAQHPIPEETIKRWDEVEVSDYLRSYAREQGVNIKEEVIAALAEQEIDGSALLNLTEEEHNNSSNNNNNNKPHKNK